MFFCIVSNLFSANLQKTYTSRDDIYQRIDALCMRAGVLGPSNFTPVSGRILEIALERINYEELSARDKEEYDCLMKEIFEDERLFTSEYFSADIDMTVNLSFNIADYEKMNYESGLYYNGFTKNRRNDELIPYRYQIPSLLLWPQFFFGDSVFLEGAFSIGNNGRRMYESSFGWLLTNVSGQLSIFGSHGSALAPELPYRAGASIGNDYLSFILGRYPHSIGSGITGNLVVGDNFNYQEIANLSFVSNYFSYNISFTRFDSQFANNDLSSVIPENSHIIGFSRNEFRGGQQFRVVHRFDFNLFDRFMFSVDLATLYSSDNGFDIRFFYPFMIAHNYYNYANWTEKEEYDEANNLIGLEAEFIISKGLSIYVQGAIDQFQMYFEDQDDLPAAWGIQGNIKYSTQIGEGTLNTWFETTYTNPYLYLNTKYADDKGNRVYDYNLDYIVGYHSQYLDDYGFSGYVYGPDSLVFSLGGNYYSKNNIWYVGLDLFLRIQGQNVIRHKYRDHQYTYIDISNAMLNSFGKETPSGGWENAEYLFKVDITGGYVFDEINLELFGGVGLNTYFNFENQHGVVFFVPQATIGIKWTGINPSWFK